MGQETSRPVSRGANGPSSRRISRYLRRGDGAGDDDGRPHTQEELEAPTPGPHYCAPASDHHLDDNPHLAQGHRLVRAHDSQPEQAPPTTETGKATGRNRSSKEDRMGSTAMAESPEAASDTTAATSKAPGTSGEEEAAPSALAQVQATTPASATPAPSTCSAQSLEQSRECILDPAPASTSSPASPTTAISPTTQSLEQPGERVLDSTSTTGPATAASPAPIAPITTMESLQSALASSHPATSPDSVAPTIAPTVSSSTLPTIPTQQPLAPSSPSSIPRPLPLGTTMIVQGLVQTIEVSRIPSRNATAPTTTNEEPNTTVEETKPLLDKGKEKEAGETNGKEISEPLASGSSTSTPISNTPVSDSNDPDVPSNDTLSDTPASPSNSSTSSDDTPSTSSNGTSAESIAVTSPSPRPTSPRSTSPSSTDVLGLLLSIAAQATAEALVPWSVPPRSRSTPREGIASGLAAAFSALAGAGAGVTTANASSGTGATVPEPLPPQPILRPLRSIRPMDPEPQSSSRLASGPSPRRFSRLSLSPGRMSSLSSRRISSIIPSRSTDTGRVVSSPAPRRAPSPTPRRSSSAPAPKPPRRGVLGRIERWVPRRLRRDSQAGPSRRASSPTELPIDESVDFGRAPPPSTLPVSALPESSVSPLPSPPLSAEPPTISVPSLPAPDSSSPISAIPVPPPPPPPVPSTLPSRPPSLSSTPTTDAEELIRFSQMLGFTPGVVHPTGTFERFLSDMQDELRVALGEYQERVRGRTVEGVRENNSAEGNTAGGEENANGDAEGNVTSEGDDERSRTAALLDHTRPHVPSTDPLPLNWWRMYRFPALPDGTPTRSNSSTPSTTPTSVDETATPATTTTTATSPAETSSSTDAESQPIHPAIIIGLRSISRDPTEEPVPSSPSDPENGGRARSSETGDRVRSPESGERVRSFESERIRSRSRRLRLGDDEDRRTREGTRNYIIWIIGGYYPSNHPILAHPNLFLGQVHPDELWMLNEFLGQVKPPTATREDIDKAGLRVVKGTEVKELAKSGSVTENCTERCLICLDDYNDDEDLRIMTCKHMFHKDCVDRWMETGRNNCPACRSKGVETTPTPAPESTPTATA